MHSPEKSGDTADLVSPGDTAAVPFGAKATLRGRPDEVAALIDELQQRLEEMGWSVAGIAGRETVTRATQMTLGDQWLAVTSSAAGPDQFHLPFQVEIVACGMVADRTGMHEAISALPFTPLELELIESDMPLTSSAPERMSHWLPSLTIPEKPLAGHGAIFTIHHQTDFVLLLEKALELGLDRDLVTVIDKEYRYRHAHRVDAHIRQRLGIPVYRYSEVELGISDHIRRVESARVASGADTWTPTIVVDDGGYILPPLLKKFGTHLSLFKGVVEQTTSGIWALRPFHPDLKVPIFSVAESKLKASVEAHGVAQASLSNLRQLLPHENLNGRSAVVVGYGTIGRALADLLRRHNVNVHVADNAASMAVAAREQGFDAESSAADLIGRVQPRYIFSCAGPQVIDRECIARIARDCILVSLTSRDFAFDKHALAELAKPMPLDCLGTMYVKDEPSCAMLLVADGFPVNFHFSESMPNQQSDLVMASLLVGLLTLACSSPSWPPGNDAERADGVLDGGMLLADFLAIQSDLSILQPTP